MKISTGSKKTNEVQNTGCLVYYLTGNREKKNDLGFLSLHAQKISSMISGSCVIMGIIKGHMKG